MTDIDLVKPQLAPTFSPQGNPEYMPRIERGLKEHGWFVSPKIDGIRCMVQQGLCLSRRGDPLRSYQLQEMFGDLNGYDGEAVCGDPAAPNVYNTSSSHIMAYNKPGALSLHVFDYFHPDWLAKAYHRRLEELERVDASLEGVNLVPHELATDMDGLLRAEAHMLELGYEGVMLNNPEAPYKQGRGTVKQGIVFKLKREEDVEVELTGLIERMRNENEQERGALGQAKRSTAKEGLVPCGSVGKFRGTYMGREISVAPGQFSHEELQDIWDSWPRDKGRLLKARHFPHGAKDELRQARALGFREATDL